MRQAAWLPVAALLLAAGCDSGRHSASGFRLPENGDAARGKAAFVAFECHRCHEVSGAGLPRTEDEDGRPIKLGGEVPRVMTDGYLVTSIIHPSHELAQHPGELVSDSRGNSRMPGYGTRMTVDQLTDIVAFLQSSYTVRRPQPGPMYH